MKKVLLTLSFILTATVIVIISCSKEETNQKPESINQIPEYELKVSRIIKDFKQQMAMYHENPQFKSGKSLDSDSALWLLEATINYSHAFPNEYYSEFRVDSGTLSLPVNGEGKIDLGDIVTAYDEMKQQVTGYYYNSPFSGKGLCAVDLEPVSQGVSETTFLVMTITGDEDGDPPPVVLDGPFEEGDDWWYGEDEGKCYLPVYTSDAAQEFKTYMSDYIADQNTGFFFIHQFSIERKGGQTNTRRAGDPEPPDNLYDYYLYSSSTEYGTVTNDILCLEYPEMNAYFVYLKYLLYTKIPDDIGLPPEYKVELILDFYGWWEPINVI